MYLVLSRGPAGVSLTELDDSGKISRGPDDVVDLAAEVAIRERASAASRWVWDDTSRWYPALLGAGVRVDRCIDLRLCRAILRNSSLTAASALATGAHDGWDEPTPEPRRGGDALFEVDEQPDDGALREFARQRAAVAATANPARIGLLLAAESAGALIAAEMRFAGLPWRTDVHDAMLSDLLGPRPAAEHRPVKMQAVLEAVRAALDSPTLNPDSPPELLGALGRAGLQVQSTRSWELQSIDHPAIAPLLEYKKMARLLSANGWNWLDTNVANGRFRPDYVPGGVVTGRWASKGGGGALQLPRQVRGAVVADPGWKLVVADAAQLEPRILAALSADRGMAEAGSAGDLYAGIVASGAVDTRAHAKVAMLGAMYGATSGESGRLLPRLARAYPRAIAFVEEAARAGERGEVVTTRLGRSSPRGASAGYDETATAADVTRARAEARSWGRFTRNFVVQGTAAEWALCWMAGLRGRLLGLGPARGDFTSGAHLVFFLHDEVVVHCPEDLAERVELELRAAAADAGRLLFGALPIEFPVTVAVVQDYGQAK
ncbi:bifunctional 3'-5' exonuclease/DNA polymerase [Marisediminicola antarctica]|uniref:DNA-directed DNA polymerase n=1 Tax=Marisediminicola antarctica TaxID=674079 RepID=A0A7L5AJB4_9MICO|nr:bifunctional 3'-5' exonuclease/DNA polymerase [Marisediminicola antarctica]QHO69885.1 bifunctional 3'-5' exonuclease/DNA polymerase [Marisediminicola antarctica]